jgi:hypothetical protein
MGIYGHAFDTYKKDNVIVKESGIIGLLHKLFREKQKNKEFKQQPKTKYAVISSNPDTMLESYLCYDSINDAIMMYCRCIYNNWNKEGNKYIVSKSGYEKMQKDNTNVEIYEYYLTDKKKEAASFTYYYYKLGKKIDSGNLIDLIKSHNIKIEIKDITALENRRKQIISKSKSIAKTVIQNAYKDSDVKRGFSISSDKEFEEEFIAGIDNNISIIDCDAWTFTDKARDESEYQKYIDLFNKIYEDFSKQIESSILDTKVDYYGDWDDGPIVVIDKKK